MKLRSIRGTHDLFGDEILKYKFIEENYSKIHNFEDRLQHQFSNLQNYFQNHLVSILMLYLKEMYTFKDRNKDLLTLRDQNIQLQ